MGLFTKRKKKKSQLTPGERNKAEIKKRLTRGILDTGQLPAIVKSRKNGKIKQAATLQHEHYQALVWKDKTGKTLLLQRKPGIANPAPIDQVLDAMMDGDAPGINNGLPDRIVIELGPNDTREGITRQLESINPAIEARLEFIGAEQRGSTIAQIRKKLEEDSNERIGNASYRKILGQLEHMITLENDAETLDNIDQRITILEKTLSLIKSAKSSKKSEKDPRNAALEQLRTSLIEQQKQLTGKLSRVKRTPSEVLVHLLHDLDETSRQNNPPPQSIRILQRATRRKILKHTMTLDETRQFLKDANNQLKASNQVQLAKLTQTLLSQLPDPEKGQILEPTRLQDNVYGRILDSAIINELVNDPPPEVITSLKTSSSAMRQFIDNSGDPETWKDIASSLAWVMNNYDTRFWFTKTPQLQALRDAENDPEAALRALRAFLDNPGNNGQALVAIPYVLVKLSILAQQKKPDKSLSPWMIEANKNYSVITRQVGRTDVLQRPGQIQVKELSNKVKDFLKKSIINDHQNATDNNERNKLIQKWYRLQDPNAYLEFSIKAQPYQDSEGAGISLRHQINPFIDPSMQRSMRPTLKNMPDINQPTLSPDGKPLRNYFPTDTVATALSHGLPFGSGASGSTNIMLHMLPHLKKVQSANGSTPYSGIGTKSYLLGTMMFLTYDGGHSLQEALWTANQLDQKLNLGLNLGAKSTNPVNPNQDPIHNQFVADYEKFASMFGDTIMGYKVNHAIQSGLKQTTGYFAEHSIYSSKLNAS